MEKKLKDNEVAPYFLLKELNAKLEAEGEKPITMRNRWWSALKEADIQSIHNLCFYKTIDFEEMRKKLGNSDKGYCWLLEEFRTEMRLKYFPDVMWP